MGKDAKIMDPLFVDRMALRVANSNMLDYFDLDEAVENEMLKVKAPVPWNDWVLARTKIVRRTKFWLSQRKV